MCEKDSGARDDDSPEGSRIIALVGATSPSEDPAALLLDDLAEALPVYALMAGVAEPRVARVGAGDAPTEPLASADAVILGLPFHDHEPASLTGLLARVRDVAAPGALAYALVCTASYDPESARDSLADLAGLCAEAGMRWMGGLVVGAADMVPRTARSPRMGTLRRRVSEALDRLALSVLAGADAGEELVRPLVPRFVYRLVAGDDPDAGARP